MLCDIEEIAFYGQEIAFVGQETDSSDEEIVRVPQEIE